MKGVVLKRAFSVLNIFFLHFFIKLLCLFDRRVVSKNDDHINLLKYTILKKRVLVGPYYKRLAISTLARQLRHFDSGV